MNHTTKSKQNIYNQSIQSLAKITFTQKVLIFLNLFSIYLPSTPKRYIVLNVENNNKEKGGEKGNVT